ncbi:MAG TPA: DUF6350 family protein [Pseudonocardiaceae bacterium]|nr:DUF6350 family protein [Pseudonocardiaceae bacterium]
MSLLLSPVAHDEPAGERLRPGWGSLLGAACLPALFCYVAIAVLLAALTATAGADPSVAWLARVGAAGWLAAHHIPLTVDGAPLGVLPLLLTLLLGALVARGAAGIAKRSGFHQPTDAGWVVGMVAGVHGIGGAALALLATPATITVDPALAAVGCALVAGVAAGVGLIRPCGLLPAALRQAPGWVLPGLLAGLWGLAVLLITGFATVLIAEMVSAPEVVELSGSAPGSAFGLIVLSIGYLPNAAIAGLSWLAGPGFSIGALAVSPFGVQDAPVPPVPLLAALPPGPAQSWWAAVVAVPLLVGAAVGRRCATGRDLPERLRVLGVAGGLIALGGVLCALLAGGRLGAAAFDPVDIPAGPLAVALLGATLLGGCPATLLPSRRHNPSDDLDDNTAQAPAGDHTAQAAGDDTVQGPGGDDSAPVPPDDTGAQAGEVGRRHEQHAEALVVLDELPTLGAAGEDDNGQAPADGNGVR